MKSDKPGETLSRCRNAVRDQGQKESSSITPRTRPRGKMYWKFATLEGWQAPKNDPAQSQEIDDD